MPKPYKRHIIIKHWGFQHKSPLGKINDYVPKNWMNLEPNCYFINGCKIKRILRKNQKH